MTLAHDLAMSLRAAYLAMHRQSDAQFAGLGVTADQFVVLVALADQAAVTQRELVARTASDANTLRAMLVLLEARGFVRREPHPTDRRARSVALTKKGRRMLNRLWLKGEIVRERLQDAFAPGEAESLIDLLRRVTSAMQRANRPRNNRGETTRPYSPVSK
jgi:DNA-binding MarR family transcriptional regulator